GMVEDDLHLLPLVAECILDPEALRLQRERYAALGRDVVEVEREPGRLTTTFPPSVDADLVRETIEVERTCCPFLFSPMRPLSVGSRSRSMIPLKTRPSMLFATR